MKVSAHPMVVAVAMGLLGPGMLETPAGDDEVELGCVDCEDSEGEVDVASVAPRDEDVDAWMARPTPTPEAQAKALADYLASQHD